MSTWTTLTHNTIAFLEPLADEKEQRIAFASTGKVPVRVDPAILRQAIINILHNAIKYSPVRSAISVRVGEDATVTIEDAGPGIAPEHASRIFDRFYRIDHGRARDAGGFGLGLSIAQWAVEAHGGKIAVAGNSFTISLPHESTPKPVKPA